MKNFQDLYNQSILVTGASGYIGPSLCKKLCENNIKVNATSRSRPDISIDNLSWYQCDLSDITLVRKLFEEINPDIIFHLAGLADGRRDLALLLPTFRSNLITTINVLTAATEIGCKRIVLPGSLEEPDINNTKNQIPSSPYAASKGASSSYALMFHNLYKTRIVNLRVFMTYGPGKQSQKKLIPYVINSLLKGEAPTLSSGRRKIDWIYIDDVVDGLIAAAQAPNIEGNTYDLGSGSLISIRNLVQLLVKMINPEIRPVYGGISERAMEQIKVANIAKTYSKIGWKPKVPIEKGLDLTLNWYKRLNNFR